MSECLSWFVTRRPFKKKKRSSIALIARSTLREPERKSQTCAHVPRRHLKRKKASYFHHVHTRPMPAGVSQPKERCKQIDEHYWHVAAEIPQTAGNLRHAQSRRADEFDRYYNWVRVRGNIILIGTEIASQLKLQRCQTVRRRRMFSCVSIFTANMILSKGELKICTGFKCKERNSKK